MTNLKDFNGIHVEGHIKIFDPISGETFINKRNIYCFWTIKNI